MDKELLRVFIIACGLVAVIVLLVLHFLKHKKNFEGSLFFGNLDIKGKINDALVVKTGSDDFDIIRKGKKKWADATQSAASAKPKTKSKPETPVANPAKDEEADALFMDFTEDFAFDEADAAPFAKPRPVESKDEVADLAASMFGDLDEDDLQALEQEPGPEPHFTLPEVIQFRVLAKSPEGFNGLDMLRAFRIAQLEYSSLKNFERLDEQRLVDFGVVCMAGNGTFPDHGLAEFFVPGLVFYMQPGSVDDPAKVFDDFLEAINLVNLELDGKILDHEKNPLTNATIRSLRQAMLI